VESQPPQGVTKKLKSSGLLNRRMEGELVLLKPRMERSTGENGVNFKQDSLARTKRYGEGTVQAGQATSKREKRVLNKEEENCKKKRRRSSLSRQPSQRGTSSRSQT